MSSRVARWARRTSGRCCRRALAVLLGTALLACGVPDGPNVVLVTFDTTRRDHTSLHGYERDTTPVLRVLGEEGVRVERAYAPTSTTGPTHASLFTGLSPLTHGVRKNGVALRNDLGTLAEELARRGWDTAGFVSSYVLTRRFGFAQGFRHWDEEFAPEGATSKHETWEGHRVRGGFDRRAHVTTDRALRWLRARGGRRPFFLFVHYYDPHAPYEPLPDAAPFVPADPSDLAAEIAAYDTEIRETDAQLGRLLEGVEESGARPTLLVVTADHGEGLLDHGIMGHGVQIYEEQVRVPFVARLPGTLPAGAVLDGPVELTALPGAVLSLLGQAPSPPAAVPASAAALASALRGESPLPEHPVFLYRRQFRGGMHHDVFAVGEKFAVIEGAWKYIEGPEEGTRELFDLSRDPEERRNLADRFPERAQDLAARIEAWRAHSERGAAATVPEHVREGLEALGYVE